MVATATGLAVAQQTSTINVSARDGQFSPAQLQGTADRPFTLKVTNLGTRPVEFTSAMLRVDRMISPKTSVAIKIGALPRGRYTFFDIANAGAHGALILK